MTAGPPAPAAAVPAALSAFLRGVERRASLFARLQCGEVKAADAALVASIQAFVSEARGLAVAGWPRRFWSMLLSAPQLRGSRSDASWPPAFARLAGTGSGPRAALLLCLVARLSESDAAAVLGVAQPTYRLALRRALPVGQDGHPDEASWHALDDAAREALRQMPAARLVWLARLREAALSGQAHAGQSQRRERGKGGVVGTVTPRRRLVAGLWAALALCGAAFVASFVFVDAFTGLDRNALTAGPVALPAAEPPEGRFEDDMALLSHPDFEQLLESRDQAVIDELGFYAWYAAGLAAQPATPMPLPDAAQPLPDAIGEPPAMEAADASR